MWIGLLRSQRERDFQIQLLVALGPGDFQGGRIGAGIIRWNLHGSPRRLQSAAVFTWGKPERAARAIGDELKGAIRGSDGKSHRAGGCSLHSMQGHLNIPLQLTTPLYLSWSSADDRLGAAARECRDKHHQQAKTSERRAETQHGKVGDQVMHFCEAGEDSERRTH